MWYYMISHLIQLFGKSEQLNQMFQIIYNTLRYIIELFRCPHISMY